MRRLSIFAALALAIALPAYASAQGPQAPTLVHAEVVHGLDPALGPGGSGYEFDPGESAVAYLTVDAEAPTVVWVEWTRVTWGGAELPGGDLVRLDVPVGRAVSVWASRPMAAEDVGQWRAIVRDADGARIDTLYFSVCVEYDVACREPR